MSRSIDWDSRHKPRFFRPLYSMYLDRLEEHRTAHLCRLETSRDELRAYEPKEPLLCGSVDDIRECVCSVYGQKLSIWEEKRLIASLETIRKIETSPIGVSSRPIVLQRHLLEGHTARSRNRVVAMESDSQVSVSWQSSMSPMPNIHPAKVSSQ